VFGTFSVMLVLSLALFIKLLLDSQNTPNTESSGLPIMDCSASKLSPSNHGMGRGQEI